MSHPVTSPSVLVVGGSLVGLSSAMFLAARGVRTIVVERHAGSSAHPRAMGFTSRTMELFRSVGIASKIPQAGPGFKLTRVVTDKVTSKAHQTTEWTQTKQKGEGAEAQPAKPEGGKPPNQLFSFELYSPYTGAAIAQDKLEPILRARAKELGVEFHLSTELVSLKQDEHGVIATVKPRDGSSGDQNQGDSTFEIRADYAVAADGAHSPIRESLGIGRSGPGQLRVVRSVLFRSYMLNSITAESGIHQWDLKQPDLETFLTTYGDSRWLLIFPENQLPAQADDSQLHALIRQATGVADLDCHTLAKGRWELAALVADRFRIGRILLAGDAAHALPPNRGGYGANTGIEDAHNLAWKLAAILQGQADASLLDSYEEERRPIALLRMQQIFARADYKAAIPTPTSVSSSPPVVQLEDVAMEFGQLYRSGAIVESDATVDVTTLPPAARPDQWAGQTGTRAPHLWVTQVKPGLLQVSATQNQEVNSSSSTSARSSTLDLFAAAGWTLLTSDASWRQTVELVSSRLLPTVVPLNCIVVGTDIQVAAEAKSDAKGTTSSNGSSNLSAATAAASVSVFESTFGWHSQEGGATLVRPDGYIAWRVKSKPENPTSELENALRRALQNNRV